MNPRRNLEWSVLLLVMAVSVVIFNRLVWRRLYQLAESRYSLSK